MKKIPKIKNKFPLLNGLFTKINYQFMDFVPSQLDIIFLSRCGDRLCSPIIDIISGDISLDYLTSEQLTTIASLLLNTYKNKWDKLLSLYDLDYNPLNSYYDTLVENVNDVTQEVIDRDSVDNVTNSRLTTTEEESSSTMEHTANNSNVTDSSRTDRFVSNYSRDLDESITRTDNLTSLAANSGTDTTLRTDNLTSTTTNSGTDTTTRTDNLSSSTVEANSNISSSTIDNEYAGFNSVDRVDTTAANNSSQSTDDNTSSTSDTGTQTIAEQKNTSVTVNNTGTQTNALQKNTSLTTTNTGTQTNVNDTTIADITTNTDNQSSNIESTLESTSSNTNSVESSSTVNDSSTNRDVLAFDETKDGTLERERTVTHSGNIGNISPQDLLLQEIELWRWNFIYEVMDDVKQFLTIPLYA